MGLEPYLVYMTFTYRAHEPIKFTQKSKKYTHVFFDQTFSMYKISSSNLLYFSYNKTEKFLTDL
jgi:hypothetical protein